MKCPDCKRELDTHKDDMGRYWFQHLNDALNNVLDCEFTAYQENEFLPLVILIDSRADLED